MRHFFGSVYFALILIAATLFFVVAGTFLESWSGSHLYAAYFTYQSPVFQLLIGLYFVNILTATLNRIPFKKRHIPFVITHIGLLMILAGVFCKSYFGVQGAMGIAEGSGSDRILLPNSYALLVESSEKRQMIPLKKKMQTEGLSITLLEWNEHSEEHFEGFIKGDFGHIYGLPPFEVDGPALQTTNYTIQALRASPQSATFRGTAALYFIQDQENKEHLVAFNREGDSFTYSFENEAFLIFDKGFGGYGVFAELPDDFPPIELVAPLTRLSRPIPPHRKKEELKPRIRMLISDGAQSDTLTLVYDKFAGSFKWPALKGKFLFRFQSLEKPIPFHIRLREAREIDYPGTTRPYSYESALLVDGEETTLSMNRVFEKKGYRFYLSNMISHPGRAKQVQIVVNYDPFKRWLTYPGAIILGLGIFLLYLRNLFKKTFTIIR
ncbi:MAG: hypothetical protein JJU12_08055 [Chlamydiales bacterium]|nr:hypothetical protein [Chlamydiales bacterium]